jgi:integrase
LKEGLRTTTIRRRIGVVRAVFNIAIRERELNITNPFASVTIRRLGVDGKKRLPVYQDERTTITEFCRLRDNDLAWIVALIADTGARLREIVGLRLEDIVLNHAPPYVLIAPNDARGVKSKASKRRVPLVGEALWAANRVAETARPKQTYAFPRYTWDGECKSNAVSAMIRKWLRIAGVQKSAHSFRHAIRDRLRNVGAPKEIQDAVGGWGKYEIGEQYGEGYSLVVLSEWLRRIAS